MVLAKDAPRSSSKYSRKGTAEHTLGERCLRDGSAPSTHLKRRIPVEHETFEVDDDMVRAVSTYVDTIRGLRDTLGATLLIEQRLDYSAPLGREAEGDAWGTGDAVLLTEDEIIAADYKGGAGEKVEVEGNTQAMLYALGAYEKFKDYGEFKTVRLMIIQPRNGGVSEWSVSVEDLLAFGEEAKRAVAQCEHAEQSKRDLEWEAVYLNPGEKQCRWCPAKAKCPELRNSVAQTVFMHTPATPEDFADEVVPDKKHIEPADDAWLSAAMAKADLIEGWLKAVRAEVERRLLAGTPVKGWKMVKGKQGNRAWTSEEEAEAALKSAKLKVDEMYSKKVISPTAAEKALADKPKVWAKIQPLIKRADAPLHVAPATDKRPAVDVTPVADEFEDTSSSDNPADSTEFA